MKARLLLILTICLCAACPVGKAGTHTRPHRYDREIQKMTFVPKGSWFGGASVSYNRLDMDDINVLIVKDIDAGGYTFNVSPFFGYFFKDNLAGGLRFNYSRTKAQLGNFDLSLGDDFNISLKDLYYYKNSYQATGFIRQYMPLGRSKIFGFFNEARVTYGFTEGLNETGQRGQASYDGSLTNAHNIKIGFAPGLTVFAQDWMALEVQMGVMGFNFKWQDQTTNQVDHGRQSNFSGQFKLDLFSISIGATIYL